MQQEPKHFESLYPETARSKEISELVDNIKQGNSSQLVGLPGVGRSSLLGLLAFNKAIRLRHFPQNHAIVHFVMTNFSEVRNRPLMDVMKFLFLNLVDSLRARGDTQEEYKVVDKMFKEALSYQEELVLTKGLVSAIEYLALEKKLTIIFLFDRFDEYVPFLTSTFFTNLRLFRDIAKYRFSVIFSLARPLEETVETQLFADFSDFVLNHTVYIKPFEDETITFRIAYLEKLTGKHIDREVLKEVLSLTGGHVRLTKLSIEALLKMGEPQSDLQNFLLSQQSIQQAVKSIWQILTPSEQHALVTEEENPEYFERIGLTREGELQIPLLKDFGKNLFGKEEAIMYDAETNTITKGDSILSDMLTKAEFKLLRFLLQHPDQVVEREEIINTVWADTVTTAGVTEQAVDQLIFRLRRKLENDPNNPQHLQTIKGRGIKFAR